MFIPGLGEREGCLFQDPSPVASGPNISNSPVVLVQTLVQWPVDPKFLPHLSSLTCGPWNIAPMVNGMILEYTLTRIFAKCQCMHARIWVLSLTQQLVSWPATLKWTLQSRICFANCVCVWAPSFSMVSYYDYNLPLIGLFLGMANPLNDVCLRTLHVGCFNYFIPRPLIDVPTKKGVFFFLVYSVFNSYAVKRHS